MNQNKEYPIATGVLDYFPDALREVAHVSFKGNQQHNPGEPLHWAREKSRDHADSLLRHLLLRGKRDEDGLRHTAKVAWRALALLQEELEAEQLIGSGEFIVSQLEPDWMGEVRRDTNGRVRPYSERPKHGGNTV